MASSIHESFDSFRYDLNRPALRSTFEDKGGSHPSRYAQDIAVERVLEAIAGDNQRILLTAKWYLVYGQPNPGRTHEKTKTIEVEIVGGKALEIELQATDGSNK